MAISNSYVKLPEGILYTYNLIYIYMAVATQLACPETNKGIMFA